MSRDLDIRIEKAYLIINRVQGELPQETKAFVDKLGLPLLGTISADEEINSYDLIGRPLVDMPENAPTYQALTAMLREIL
jgi:CO dehydrogenase maturation factor